MSPLATRERWGEHISLCSLRSRHQAGIRHARDLLGVGVEMLVMDKGKREQGGGRGLTHIRRGGSSKDGTGRASEGSQSILGWWRALQQILPTRNPASGTNGPSWKAPGCGESGGSEGRQWGAPESSSPQGRHVGH